MSRQPSSLPASPRPGRGARDASPPGPLPPRPRQALSAHGQARPRTRAPNHRDNDVPRDGHALLAGAGGAEGARVSRCPQCRHENPDDAKFCLECVRGLALMCGACGTELPAEAKFCKECGQAVNTTTPAPAGRVGAAPESYTPKHLAEKILMSKAALEGE